MLASRGFPAIATTSAGVVFSLGFPDQEAAVSRETMLDRGSIAAAVHFLSPADLQSGYGASPEEVGETIAAAIRAGVVGANIEDYSGNPAQALFDREHAVARVRAARRARGRVGSSFVLTGLIRCLPDWCEQCFCRGRRAMQCAPRGGCGFASCAGGFRPKTIGSARPGDQCPPHRGHAGLTGSTSHRAPTRIFGGSSFSVQ